MTKEDVEALKIEDRLVRTDRMATTFDSGHETHGTVTSAVKSDGVMYVRVRWDGQKKGVLQRLREFVGGAEPEGEPVAYGDFAHIRRE